MARKPKQDDVAPDFADAPEETPVETQELPEGDQVEPEEIEATEPQPAPKAKAKGIVRTVLQKFEVIVRHSPARLKKLVVQARDEAEAWGKYLEALHEYTLNTELARGKSGDTDKARREFDAFKQSQGDVSRTITKLA